MIWVVRLHSPLLVALLSSWRNLSIEVPPLCNYYAMLQLAPDLRFHVASHERPDLSVSLMFTAIFVVPER